MIWIIQTGNGIKTTGPIDANIVEIPDDAETFESESDYIKRLEELRE